MTRDDNGRVSVFLAVTFSAILLIIGVAADVGGQWRSMLHASAVAAEAARAAGQAIDVEHTARTGEHRISPTAARAAAQDYLTQAGVEGTVQVSAEGTEVTVETTITYEPQILGLFGVPPRQVTGQHTAALVPGSTPLG